MLKRTRKKKSTKNVSRLLEREVKRLWNGKKLCLYPLSSAPSSEQLAKYFTCSKDVTESLFTGNSKKVCGYLIKGTGGQMFSGNESV